MILFFNVFLTNSSVNVGYNYKRGLLPSFCSVDIFKYALSSYSVFHWEKIIIYAELDEIYQDRQNELEQFIYELFPNAEYYSTRLCRITPWREALNKHFYSENDNQLIWYWGNHDHIFIDYDINLFNKIITYMINNPQEYQSLYPTSWPEMLYIGLLFAGNTYELNPDCGFFSFFRSDYWASDAVQIINKKLLYFWFFNNHIEENTHIIRTDGFCNSPNIKCYVPLREMCRHFDGYGHNQEFDTSKCPGLIIPPNFWEDLKIRAYYDDANKEYVNINPLKSYSNTDINGVDIKGIIGDIPMFWKKYIKTLDINTDAPDKSILLSARNLAQKDIAEAHTAMTKPSSLTTWCFKKE